MQGCFGPVSRARNVKSQGFLGSEHDALWKGLSEQQDPRRGLDELERDEGEHVRRDAIDDA